MLPILLRDQTLPLANGSDIKPSCRKQEELVVGMETEKEEKLPADGSLGSKERRA